MYIKTGYPDVLYIVKASEDNEELKYSLRSLKNLNHGRVFIAGYKPTWVDDRVEYIPSEQAGNKYGNVRMSWRAALNDPRLSDDFILMNDDFFIMRPTKRIPVLRRLKNIDHYIDLFSKVDNDSYYVRSMRQTRELLHSWGIVDIDSYELHVPMVFNKQKLRALTEKVPAGCHPAHIRTLYGNYYNIGGRRVRDVKIINDHQRISYDQRFLSTIDGSFDTGKVGEFLRKKFAKALVFSRANDPDGLLSVILAQLAFAEVDYLLTNKPQADILAYLQTHAPDNYDYVIIADIYPGRPVLELLPNALWFDHKQSSLEKMQRCGVSMPNAIIRTTINGRPTSASELLYLWLCEQGLVSTKPAEFVELIRQQDTWDFK